MGRHKSFLMNLNKDKDDVFFEVVEKTSDNFRILKSPSKLIPKSSKHKKKKLQD